MGILYGHLTAFNNLHNPHKQKMDPHKQLDPSQACTACIQKQATRDIPSDDEDVEEVRFLGL